MRDRLNKCTSASTMNGRISLRRLVDILSHPELFFPLSLHTFFDTLVEGGKHQILYYEFFGTWMNNVYAAFNKNRIKHLNI